MSRSDLSIYEFRLLTNSILNHELVMSMSKYRQHSDVDCLQHSINVAYQCYKWYKIYNLKISIESTITGALLHDFFLYDWHDKQGHSKLHAFNHPREALKNAQRSFKLNSIEEDIIVKHMFPLTLRPPKYKESWLVLIADKYVASKELLKLKNALCDI
ncbi:MAG: phosphohydrolase [Erysipelotrichaceae bacterium]|nr:phosphohydrolase [Erysipelotrichaceae bacterium]